jgi:hypothetical protein
VNNCEDILHKLPNNYFMEEDEDDDYENNYNFNQTQEQARMTSEIQNILQPSKFIEMHF